MSARLLGALFAASAVLLAAAALAALDLEQLRRADALGQRRIRSLLRRAIDEGVIDESFGGRRVLGLTLLAGGVAGFSLLGVVGIPLGTVCAPAGLRLLLRSRHRRHAARIDAGATELALALASSLASGRSVRGRSWTAASSVPQPLASELDRVAIDLTLGRSTTDALTALRARTRSPRIESLVGAIALQRGSGGDLVRLMRELAAAFRARDRALEEAHTASAQARYTALVVAAMPLLVAIVLELASPGAVSGALRILPTALMLLSALAMITAGVLLSHRIATVRE